MSGRIRIVVICALALALLFDGSIRSYAASLSVPPYPPTVEVEMHELDSDGTRLPYLCTPGNTNFGCSAYCRNFGVDTCEYGHPAMGYPYSTSTINLPIGSYYLLDVLSQEMNPWIYDEPAALHAQAIAARSYVGWNINNISAAINNSTDYQVFVPYKFDSLNPSATPLEPNTTAPCFASSLNDYQLLACAAIASGNYIAREDNNPYNLPAFAEFTSDVKTATHNHPQVGTFPYLAAVNDPVSTACDSKDNGVNLAGMSQMGANRWARGHECSRPGAPVEPGNIPGATWSVRWNNAEQILFHIDGQVFAFYPRGCCCVMQ